MYPLIGQPAYPELWRGCVGAWAPCLGPTGLTLHDWSGYRTNATLTNMDASSDWVVSQGRYALDLDASNDYLVTGNAQFSTAENIAISFTLIQRTRATGVNSAVFDITSSSRSFILQQADVGGNIFLFTDGVDGSNNITLSGSEVPTLNRVNHLVFQFIGTSYQWWINGVMQKAGSIAGRFGAQATAVNIGRRVSGVLGFTDMLLFDAAIYKRSLVSHEIKLLSSRPGIAYDLAPRRRGRVFAGGFKAYWAARKAQIIGGGL